MDNKSFEEEESALSTGGARKNEKQSLSVAPANVADTNVDMTSRQEVTTASKTLAQSERPYAGMAKDDQTLAQSDRPYAGMGKDDQTLARSERPYAGMGKDDLLRFSKTPFWNRLRLGCLIVFWLGWLALLASVIVLTVVMPRCKVPPTTDWWQKSIIYDIYVKSFYDSDNDGVGDIKGIEAKLDYIANLNVDTICLSSIYKSAPGPNHVDLGFEIIDYLDVDGRVGTLNDLRSLVTVAHEKGLRVLMDFVPNHTSDQHPWFRASRTTVGNDIVNPMSDYYIWQTCSENNPPSNWRSVYGGSAWTLDEERSQCYYHNFLETQPELNLRNENVKQELQDVLNFWIAEIDIDGFRVNSVSYLVEDADFSDEPSSSNCTDETYDCLDHVFTRAQGENYNLVTNWRTLLEECSTERYRILLTDSQDKINDTLRYYGNSALNGAHLPINYQLSNLGAGCGGRCVQRLIESWRQGMPFGATANWMSGNYDIGRLNAGLGVEYTATMHMMTLTLPGTAFNYYGDELGMRNGNISTSPVDPACLGNLVDCRDPYRSPMQWTDGVNGGFSNSRSTWLPLNDDAATRNVKIQEADHNSLLQLFKSVAKLRKEEESMQFGNLIYSIVNENIISYVREYEGRNSFLVALNFGTEPDTTDYSSSNGLIPDEAEVVITTTVYKPGTKVSLKALTLGRTEGIILKWGYSR